MAKSSLKTADRRIKNVDVKKYNVLGADSDNNYFGRMENILNASNTGKACLKTFIRFAIGEGLTDQDFGKSIINRKGLTVNKLVRSIATSIGKTDGVAIHVNYNGLSQSINFTPVEFSYCRIGIGEKAGKIAVYDNWDYSKSKKIKSEDITYYDQYAPHQVLKQVDSIELDDEELKTLTEQEQEVRKWKKYDGQIFWYSPDGSYPLAPFDEVAEDMQTEGNVSKTKRTSSASNFMPSQMMVIPEFDSTDDGNEERDEFYKNLESFQGDDAVGSIFVLESNSPELEMKLEKIEIQNYDGIQKYTEESVKENIRENRLIPAALLTDKSSSFSGEQIKTSYNAYNATTTDDRKLISEILELLFKNYYKDINPSNNYSIQPLVYNTEITEEYFPYYSKEEIRASKGDTTENEKEASETPLSVELGVGSTQALIDLVANPDLSDNQKIGSMKIVFGLSEEEAKTMLGL